MASSSEKTESESNPEVPGNSTDERPVSILLGVGILLIPIIFSWFTLRKGYTTKAKSISFIWLVFILIISGIQENKPRNIKENSPNIHNLAKVTMPEKWYEGGTLHQENGLVWQKASNKNKLATCADIVANMWSKKMFKQAIQNKIHSVDDLKPLAQELVVALDGAFKKDEDDAINEQIFTNQKVTGTAAILITMMGWL